MEMYRVAIFFSLFLLVIVKGQLGFDCRRKDVDCVGGDGECQVENGTCTCPQGQSGYNCGFTETKRGTCSSVPQQECQNGATCLTGNTCFCSSDTYGPYCQNFRVAVWCSTSEMFINVNPPVNGNFTGKLFVYTDDVTNARDTQSCQLKLFDNPSTVISTLDYVKDVNQITPTGLAGYYIKLTHDNSPCGTVAPRNITSDNGTLIRTEYFRRVVIEYNPLIMSSLDQIINANCSIADTNNLTTYSTFSAVAVSIKSGDDYQQVNISDTIEPILFEIKDANGRAITNSISLGDQMNLKFTLQSSDYAKIKVKECKATSGLEEAQNIIFFTDNCPAPEWSELFRGYMLENGAENSTTLQLSAFRFTGNSDTVTFICSCQLCTGANLDECARNSACAPPSEATSGDSGNGGDQSGGGEPATANATQAQETEPQKGARKKRAADTNQLLTGTVQVKAVGAGTSNSTQGGTDSVQADTKAQAEEDCMDHSEVVVIIVTFSVALALMLILVVALVIRMLRSRTKVVDASDLASADSQSNYTLPRPSVTNF